MKKIFLFAFFILCGFIFLSIKLSAQAPNWQWAKTTSQPTTTNFGNSICLDASGNSYVTGYFYDTISFGSNTLISNGIINMFLVKYDQFGNVLWAKNPGGSSTNQGNSVASDDSGNVFVAGHFSDGSSETTIFGSTIFTYNPGGEALFLAKYDSDGNALWAKRMGGDNDDEMHSVATDGSGNAYVTGYFRDPTAVFGSFTLTSADNGLDYDVFIAKFDPSGNVLWANGYGGNSGVIGFSVTTDASNNCYVGGFFSTLSITFGFNTLTGSGGGNPFLVKYDSAGNVLWARGAAANAYNTGVKSVSTDAAGNSYVTGSFQSPTITFGSFTLTNADNSGNSIDIFLVKYGPSGNVLWAKRAGGPSYDDFGNSVSTDSTGNVYIAGYFTSAAITFGSTTLTNSGSSSGSSSDLFLAKYNPSGTVLWAKSATGSAGDVVNCIATDTSDNCYVTGFFDSPTIAFGSINLTGSVTQMFISKTGIENGLFSPGTISKGISVFPNPVSDVITFQTENSIDEIIISDQLGKGIRRQKMNGEKQIEISVSDLADGMYFYRVVEKDNTISAGKFIVQH